MEYAPSRIASNSLSVHRLLLIALTDHFSLLIA
jgi:hypothetical protein